MTQMSLENSTADQQADGAEELLRCWPGQKLLEKNIEVLREVDADLAGKIMAVEIPSEYQLAVAKDGSVSYQHKCADGTTQWLGKSSIPMIFSKANKERVDVGQGNLVMQGFGHGADVLAILEKMAPCQALFVIEQESLVLRLAFELRDYSLFLRQRQLVILLGDSVNQLIDEFYQGHEGYHIIKNAAVLPCWSQKENQVFAKEINVAMESCVSRLAGEVARLMEQQAEMDSQRNPDEIAAFLRSETFGDLKAVHRATCYRESVVTTGQTAMAGLAALGVKVDKSQYDRPDQVSSCVQLRRMLDVWPHLVVLVDALRGEVSPTLPKFARCVSLLRNPPERLLEKEHSPAELMGPNDFVFAESPEQLTALQEAQYPEDRIGILPVAAQTQIYQPAALSDEESHRYSCDIVLVASRVDSDAESYGVTLPTHQRLWQAMAAEICDGADKYHSGLAQRYLKRAQRCGVEVKEEELLNHFGKLLEVVLGDAVLRDFFVSYLLNRDLKVKIWGRTPLHPTLRGEQPNHWEQSAANEVVAGEVAQGSPLNALYNAAKIHLSISSHGRVDEFLLNGIAAGAFFLIKSHPSDTQPGGLGEFFEIGKEIVTFDSPNDLVRKAKQYLRDDAARKQIAEAGRQRCLADHSETVRMKQMLAMLARQ